MRYKYQRKIKKRDGDSNMVFIDGDANDIVLGMDIELWSHLLASMSW